MGDKVVENDQFELVSQSISGTPAPRNASIESHDRGKTSSNVIDE
jgi:hypothetical protein